MKRRTLLGAGVGVGLLTLAGCGEKSPPPPTAQVLLGQTLPDLHGVPQPLEQWRARPMLVNFWATWCAPCLREMPDLERLSQQFPDIVFVGIGIDSPDKMREFVRKVPVSYPLLEARATGMDMMRDLGNSAGGLPFTAVFASDGTLRRAIAGQIKPDDLSGVLRSVT